MGPMTLRPGQLSLALVRPQIAPNTGNVGRLCVATGTALHLVRPLGFALSDKEIKRSGMDYWARLRLTVHDDVEAFEAGVAGGRLWLFDSAGDRGMWDADFAAGDTLVFGSETRGLPEEFVGRHRQRLLRIPQVEGERCLNLATAAGIALYAALYRIDRGR
jgi:tRNA (cytidine/uridine-2'-O-)-methyltransferase